MTSALPQETAQHRVLIIGNSHAGALRSAKEEFETLYPEVSLSFFASPGTSFKRGRPDKENNFVPKLFGDDDAATVVAINGCDKISLNGYDHILAVGHRPDLFGLCGLAGQEGGFGVLDLDIEAPHFLSRELVEDWLDHILDPWVKRMARLFGAQKGFSFTDAPYRSLSMLDEGETRREAQQFAQFQAIPFLGDLMTIYDQKLAAKLSDHGFGLVQQPLQTRAAPFATDARFCRGAADAAGDEISVDHRHMNAAFGLEILTEFANKQLGLPVRTSNG
ncbi:hypothetical protein K3X13_08565 [Aliiroseovarius crassostreae]|uniref:hypothetical protein n=1 Tax=Aliiroseovarius crassostreae TaxID=154981 RepID=UPI0021FF1335|nr:hypothetical protein [Aliiroseovarius crassostreae]UWP91149.1 hypothetical protein K3X13_08565 [Aliiroseovarius crassostreae]UWP97461.1 hypothetical protein K3X53_08565 [Aliiroseovarius crassostreae]